MFAKAISAKIYLQTHICKDIFAKAITANIYLRECVIVGRRRSTMCWLCAKWPPQVEVPRIPSPYFGKQGQALIPAAVLTPLAILFLNCISQLPDGVGSSQCGKSK